MTLRPFTSLWPRDIEESREFYARKLGFHEGSTENWIDFNVFGHQFVTHQIRILDKGKNSGPAPVDNHGVPIPHCGVIMHLRLAAVPSGSKV